MCFYLDFGRKWAPNLWAGASIFHHFFDTFSELGFGSDFGSFWVDFGCILELFLNQVWSNYTPFRYLFWLRLWHSFPDDFGSIWGWCSELRVRFAANLVYVCYHFSTIQRLFTIVFSFCLFQLLFYVFYHYALFNLKKNIAPPQHWNTYFSGVFANPGFCWKISVAFAAQGIKQLSFTCLLGCFWMPLNFACSGKRIKSIVYMVLNTIFNVESESNN